MRLCIIDNDSNVHEVSDCIDEYNLDKPIARADIIERIQEALERIKVEQGDSDD